MLLRIVKMEFDPAQVEAFDDLFARAQARIEAMPGCHQVRLLKGHGDKPIRTTLSWWERESDLRPTESPSCLARFGQKRRPCSVPPVAWSSDWPADEPIPGAAE